MRHHEAQQYMEILKTTSISLEKSKEVKLQHTLRMKTWDSETFSTRLSTFFISAATSLVASFFKKKFPLAFCLYIEPHNNIMMVSHWVIFPPEHWFVASGEV